MKSITERNPMVIGTVAIVAILAATFAALFANANFITRSYTLRAQFVDDAGLRTGDQVTVAGVAIGRVAGIKEFGGGVRVSMAVKKGTQLPSDTTAAIRVETLLGKKTVRLQPGSDWAHLMRAGTLIDKTTTPTDVLELQSDTQHALADLDAQSFNNFLKELSAVTSGKQADVAAITQGLDRLATAVDSRQDTVKALIDEANTLAATVNGRDQELESTITNLEAVMDGLAQRRVQLAQLLSSTDAAASRISQLVATNRPQLDQVLAELHTDLGILNQHQVDLAQSIAYLGSGIKGFASIGYSGPQDSPNTWANVFTVGLGPASPDPVFGCGGAIWAALDAAIGPDPDNCAQAAGPTPAGAAPAPPGAGSAPAATAPGRPTAPPDVPAATATHDSLNALLVPLLAG